jgi:hypothetical protein
MSICEGFAHLFTSIDAAEQWWQQMLCRMFTTACQLCSNQEDACILLYGGKPDATETGRDVIGAVARLERKINSAWRPESVGALEGFLWSRLHYEYRTLLCLVSGIAPQRRMAREILELARAPEEDDPAVGLGRTLSTADERQAHAKVLDRTRVALAGKPRLLELLDALTSAVIASEDANEDIGEGWRKRILQRVGDQLGLNQAALHQRLKRIRGIWESVAAD